MAKRDSAFPSHGTMGEVVEVGLTKRELFAAMAMQAILSNPNEEMVKWDEEFVAHSAREHGDALLAELEKNERMPNPALSSHP
jgi:hypothetical protein